MAFDNYQWSYKEIKQRNELNAISTQLAIISGKLDNLNILAIQRPFITRKLCGGAHTSDHCPIYAKPIQYVGNYSMEQDYFYFDKYHLNWGDHLNFAWCNT